MEIIDIVKIIGAIAAVVGTSYTVWNSKRSILRRIERKEARVRNIDHKLILLYGLNRGSCHPITYLDERKDRLNEQISDLKKLL